MSRQRLGYLSRLTALWVYRVLYRLFMVFGLLGFIMSVMAYSSFNLLIPLICTALAIAGALCEDFVDEWVGFYYLEPSAEEHKNS